MDRLKRVVERGDKQGFQLMGPYTNPLWNQMAVQADCILVDNRLAVAVQLQLRPAVLKLIPEDNQIRKRCSSIKMSVHKDIVNLAEERRSCTRYGENAKYTISQIASKPRPLLTQPG